MRAERKADPKDKRYRKTEKFLSRTILSLFRRDKCSVSVQEVCTKKRCNTEEESKQLTERRRHKFHGRTKPTRAEEEEDRTPQTFYNHYKNMNDAVQQIEAATVERFRNRLLERRAAEIRKQAQRAKQSQQNQQSQQDQPQQGTQSQQSAQPADDITIPALPENGSFAPLTPEQVLSELVLFAVQNKSYFLTAAECLRFGPIEELYRIIYPSLATMHPNYDSPAAKQQIYWNYASQSSTILLAWARQTECDLDDSHKCLQKLIAVHQHSGAYLREMEFVPYRNQYVAEEELPENIKTHAASLYPKENRPWPEVSLPKATNIDKRLPWRKH